MVPRPSLDDPATPASPPRARPRPETAPGWLRTFAGWSWRLLVSVAAVALVVWAVDKVLLALVAVFVALVFTAVLAPLVRFLDRYVPRAAATAVAVLVGVMTALGVLAFVGWSVVEQWTSLERQFDEAADRLVQVAREASLPVPLLEEQIESWTQAAQSWLREHRGEVTQYALAGISAAGLIATTLALAIFLTVFFLARGRQMWEWFLGQLPDRSRTPWQSGGEAAWGAFSGYTAGTVIIALIDAALAFALLLALGVPLAAPLSVVVFVGALVPLVGAPAAMVLAMIVALVSDGLLNAALVGVGIALIGQLEGHVLEPLIMGRAVRLHPVVVALAVTVGALVAGILGAVLAVPVVATAWAVFTRLREPPEDRTATGAVAGSPRG